MELSELDLGDLRAFFLVAETGSFARAATRLEQAKSVVSRRVSRLEQVLSAPLLVRTATGATLTEAGTVFYEEARLALEQLQQATDSISSLLGELSGPIRITGPVYFGTHYLADALTDFMRLHPGVEMEVQLCDEKLDLVRHGFDLAVRAGRLSDSSLIARTLTQTRRYLVASPDYLRSHPPITVPEDLSAHAILHYNSVNTGQLWKYFVDGQARQLEIKPYLRSNSGAMLMAAVAAGQGLAVMPNYVTHPYVATGQAVQVLPDLDWGTSPINLILPAGRSPSRRVRALADFLVARFQAAYV